MSNDARALRAIEDAWWLASPTLVLAAIEAAGLAVVDRERLARLEADAAAWQSHRAATMAIWGKDGSSDD